jgi:hypothetical protein
MREAVRAILRDAGRGRSGQSAFTGRDRLSNHCYAAYLVLMKSPNGQYNLLKADFKEIRMGSPLFGTIELRGSRVDTQGSFGEPMAFSPDSKFLAVEHLVDATASGPHVQVVVLELQSQRRLVVHDQNPGLVRRFEWTADGALTITVWSHLAGENEIVWRPPSSGEPPAA